MKSAVRRALVQPWINALARPAAKALPLHWRSRLPVNVPLVTLSLDKDRAIVLAQPHRCHVAQELYWGEGELQTAQDRHALKAALAFSRDAAIFLDIGSYTGLFALVVARANPAIHSYAYEIVGENYLLLWENVLHNDLGDRVHPRLVAVGGEDGEIRIPYAQSSGQLASSVDIGWSTDHGVRVPMRRLDDLHLDSAGPVALKIDVEGFEMEVFDGAQAFLAKHRPDMVCEVLRRAKRVPEMMELLGGLGYRWFHIREDGFARRDTIVADKVRRDWLLTCKTDAELEALGLELVS
ncbi:FkbM family methyltransferase [Parerythrobacter lacustris]|uniref:FkbM family methyltransferase n=1 Tax=Parerythrobacter lacustris TaxID=2969984 RepID=A0ABT1XUS0_9SPHN|nr:FkbM family methyltransferase [Parerythrobacter lacustris]MCR2834405.1 FkbM family methyltransferase [Parerythrobacter lacustris]